MARNYPGGSSGYHRVYSSLYDAQWTHTVAAWFDVTSDNGATNSIIVHSGGGNGAQGGFHLNAELGTTGNPLRMRTENTGGVNHNAADTGNSVLSGWNHACGIIDSDSHTVAVLNGDWTNRGTASTYTRSWTNLTTPRTTIGCTGYYGGGTRWFDGQIGPITIWNVELTQAEVEALAGGVHPLRIRPASIIRHLEMRHDGDAIELIGRLDVTEVGTVTVIEDRPLTRAGVVIPFAIPSAGGVTVNVPSASLALAGALPEVAAGASVSSPSASLALAGALPTIAAGASVQAPAASLALAAAVPTITASTGTQVNVPAASLALAAAVPGVGAGAAVDAPAASLALTAAVPTITAAAGTQVNVPAASLALVLELPSIAAGAAVSAPAAVLAYQAALPLINFDGLVVDVPAAALLYQAQLPAVRPGIIAWPDFPEDWPVFFDDVDGFGETVTYQGTDLVGIFDDHSGDGEGPRVRLQTEVIDTQGIDRGDTVLIRGRTFEVRAFQGDGTGTTVIPLLEL